MTNSIQKFGGEEAWNTWRENVSAGKKKKKKSYQEDIDEQQEMLDYFGELV
jgi:hypothetical protein